MGEDSRLTTAIDGFDPASHARPRALCLARLALLHAGTGDLDQATDRTRQTLEAATGIRSARLSLAVSQIRTPAAEHPDQPAAQQLVDQIDTANGAPPVVTAPGPRSRRWMQRDGHPTQGTECSPGELADVRGQHRS